MNYIIESILVGIYTCIIYVCISPFIKNIFILLIICGFFKHVLGYTLNIWTWYCNHGEACQTNKKSNPTNKYKASNKRVLVESVVESILFLFIGSILQMFIKTEIAIFFILGFSLHVFGENLGIHAQFCRRTCQIK